MENIFNKKLEDLQAYFLSIGQKKYKALQIYDWLYKKRVFTFAKMTNLKKDLILKLEEDFKEGVIPKIYAKLIEKNSSRINQNAKNIEKIAITDTYTVASKVKEIFKVLVKKKKFVFNKLFSINKRNKQEVVTAFTGLLELSRRSKVITNQEKQFGDITVEKAKKVS